MDLNDKNIIENQNNENHLIFISHASKDKEVLKLFVDNILRRGLNLADENIVFTSYEATGVVPGDNIPSYIKNNILAANVVLAMVSPNYKVSTVCMNEVGAAWALEKVPIQIMLPNTNIDNLGWLLHLDKAARIDDEDSLDSLMEVICKELKIKPITPKHWNPCKRDFLNALKDLPDCYDTDKPEYMLLNEDNTNIIVCHPCYVKKRYCERITKSESTEYSKVSKLSVICGSTTPEFIKSIQSLQKPMTYIQPKIISKTTNYSYVKIQLHIVNNSTNPIQNGEIHIWSNNEQIVFAETNVKKMGSLIAVLNIGKQQYITKTSVSETFSKPINPSARINLYEFYITAPHTINEFKLHWKLESLSKPAYGEIVVKWLPEYKLETEVLDVGNPKIGTTEILEQIKSE